MNKQKSKAMLQQYYEIKRTFQLPLKLRLYFSTLQGLIDGSQNPQISKQQVVDSLLLKAFQKQREQQKLSYLLEMMKMLQRYYFQGEDHKTPKEEDTTTTINNIETTCNMQTFSFKLSHWSTSKFKLDKLKRSISIHNKKKNFSLTLQQYLIRKSNKHTNTIVLQAIHKDISLDYQKISLQFKEEIYQVIYQQLFQVITHTIKDSLLQMAKESTQEINNNPLDSDTSFAFLTSEQISNYLTYKSQIIQRLQVGGFSFKNIYHKTSNEQQIKIERSSKIDKIFKLQCLIKRPISQIKTDFLQAINNKYKYKVQTNILEQFSKKYRAVYDKYVINSKIYQQICIKQQSNGQKQQIYFSKGMENVLTGNNLQFMLGKVKPTQNVKINKLIIAVSLILTKDINLEIAIAFLLQFRNMLDRQNGVIVTQVKQQQFDEDQFFSIVEHPIQTNQDQFDSDQYKTENKQFQELVLKQKYTYSHQYLKHHYHIHSLTLTPQQMNEKRLKQHFFKNVWGRQKKGGLVCINEAMNQEQRNVIKKIVANLGSNLYKIVKSGNFMNCSLPLGIFKKASHLEIIGNNLAYAPILFDRFHQQPNVDILQRFKSAILLNISVSNLGISLQKPFNPILGETLQCWIGGCPLYLQQISHHPPISCYYFQGRGYKIHGCIDPKMSIGLNSLSCWSQKPNYIEFQDGTQICLTFGKMLMSGFIFGDRQFNYQDRTYLYDKKNHLFCTMYFGAKKKGIPKNEANDFVHGRIFKTTPQFLSKFTSKAQMYPQKKDIQAQLSSFQGIWNECINFDGKQYINFSTQLPYLMQQEQLPLPSNYSFRKDLSLYHQDNIVKAQQQKEILEQIQRRDRKLRDQYRK